MLQNSRYTILVKEISRQKLEIILGDDIFNKISLIIPHSYRFACVLKATHLGASKQRRVVAKP
jgi:hypothetical protein